MSCPDPARYWELFNRVLKLGDEVLSMNLLLELAANPDMNPVSLPAASALVTVGVVGFLAAAGIGSIAWYNSKRPVGWEDKERPSFVPDIDENHPASEVSVD